MTQPVVVAERELVGPLDLSDELWREYEFLDTKYVYRIWSPQKLWYRNGGRTHRVEDANGVVHCVLGPGESVVLRWQPRDSEKAVQF